MTNPFELTPNDIALLGGTKNIADLNTDLQLELSKVFKGSDIENIAGVKTVGELAALAESSRTSKHMSSMYNTIAPILKKAVQ